MRTRAGAGSALSEYLMLRPSRPRFMDEEAEAQKGLYEEPDYRRHGALIQTQATLL